MQSKKKGIHLQQFGIIHLPNQDLTYIRNPGRNKIMYVLFHLLKNLHQESFSIIYFFFTLPPRGETTKATTIARAYMRVGRWVLPSFYFCRVGLPNCWRPIFLLLPELYGCQVGLPNCRSCSNSWIWVLIYYDFVHIVYFSLQNILLLAICF
jgi:hypothetical protein